MGTWKTERGRGSDELADILGRAFERIGTLGYEYTLEDLADGIEFASCGSLVVELHAKAVKNFEVSRIYDQNQDTIINRGQLPRVRNMALIKETD